MGRRLLLILGMILLASPAIPVGAVRMRLNRFRSRQPMLLDRPFRPSRSRTRSSPRTIRPDPSISPSRRSAGLYHGPIP